MNRKTIDDPQVPFTPADLQKKGKPLKNPSGYGLKWERNVYKGFHDCVSKLDTGWVIRLYKPKFTAQIIDILIDGVDGEFYAIECKSSTKFITYPTQWFGRMNHWQLKEEVEFLHRTGRFGVIAFLMPSIFAGGVVYHSYLVPFGVYIRIMYGSGRSTAGDLDALAKMGYILRIPAKNGTVNLTPDVFEKLHTCMQLLTDTLGTQDGRAWKKWS